uniref:VWFC domain-containing protein n=1 Tax=Knipowitschia caucasica TaxID=637954 RepID=A0AAV2KWB3_KNICA
MEKKNVVETRLQDEMTRNSELHTEVSRMRTLVKTAKKKLRDKDMGEEKSREDVQALLNKETQLRHQLEMDYGDLVASLKRSLVDRQRTEEELRSHLEAAEREHSQVEERSRQQLQRKLDEVNRSFQTQNTSQKSLLSQMEHRIRELEDQVSKNRCSEQDSIRHLDITQTELHAEAGHRECTPLPCPPLDCTHTVSVPGECCQKCRGCVHEGSHYDHNAKWTSVNNRCELCHCTEGHVHCEKEQCQTPCKNPAAPSPNSCCPVCQGCGVNGHTFPNGALIPTGDRCQECTCLGGDVRCSPLPCPALPCPSPVHRVGDCCPSCDQCEFEAQRYAEGQAFSSSRDPCIQCHCSAGIVSCENTAYSCPRLRCSHPARSAGECCPSCKECEYETRVYANGNVFTPVGSGPCLHCTCKNGNVICRQEKCPPLKCSNPITDPQHCCPICKVCVVEGVEFAEGSEWRPEGPCSSCSCVDGEIRCSQSRCPPIDCLHPTKITGTCCPVCDSCTYNQRIYGNGQRFTSPEQPCQSCTCLHGTVECEKSACPPVTCTNPSIPTGKCCPKCSDCSFENRVFVDGEAFSNPLNPCEECKCKNGQTNCYRRDCPAPQCNAPLPGQCCNTNCDGCSYAGKDYPNGQEFGHPTDQCRSCTCTNGNVQCLKKRCSPLPCSKPTLQPGECCPRFPIMLPILQRH